MRYDFVMAAVLFALASLLFVGAAYVFFRRERLLGLKLIGLLAVLNGVYSVAYGGYLLSDGVDAMIGYIRMMYLVIPALMPVWYLLSLQQKDETKRISTIRIVALLVVPVVAAIAAILYPADASGALPWYRTLFYEGHETAYMPSPGWDGFIGIHFTKGILYYALAGYALTIAALAAWNFIAVARHREGLARRRAIFLAVNAILAIVLIALTFFRRETVLVDFSSYFTDWIAFATFLALFKYELFDLIPAAYSEIFRKSDYPLVILDEAKRVVSLNAAAERVFPKAIRPAGEPIGLAVLHRDDAQAVRELLAGHDVEVMLPADGRNRHYRASVSAFGRSRKKPTGYFVTYQDITEHKDEMRRMEQMAAYDELTKILNRRYFFRRATSAFDEAVANRQNVRVIMFDLDGFKDINDIYGHQAGDSILAQLAKLIAANLGPEDIFARYGGEEFIIFRKNVVESEAKLLDQKVCDLIAGHAFLYQRRSIKITGSFGVAGSRGPVNKPLERYIKEADDAMYISKTAGKNQVSHSADLQ